MEARATHGSGLPCTRQQRRPLAMDFKYVTTRDGMKINGKTRAAGYTLPDDFPVSNLRALLSNGWVKAEESGRKVDAVEETAPDITPEAEVEGDDTGTDDAVLVAPYYIIESGTPGWYHIMGPDGMVDEKKRREGDAKALADELNG